MSKKILAPLCFLISLNGVSSNKQPLDPLNRFEDFKDNFKGTLREYNSELFNNLEGSQEQFKEKVKN